MERRCNMRSKIRYWLIYRGFNERIPSIYPKDFNNKEEAKKYINRLRGKKPIQYCIEKI